MPYYTKTVDTPDPDYPEAQAEFFVDAEWLTADESGQACWQINDLRLYRLDNGDAALAIQTYGADFVRDLEAAAIDAYDGEGY